MINSLKNYNIFEESERIKLIINYNSAKTLLENEKFVLIENKGAQLLKLVKKLFSASSSILDDVFKNDSEMLSLIKRMTSNPTLDEISKFSTKYLFKNDSRLRTGANLEFFQNSVNEYVQQMGSNPQGKKFLEMYFKNPQDILNRKFGNDNVLKNEIKKSIDSKYKNSSTSSIQKSVTNTSAKIPWFNDHPHLSKVGTSDQYLQYLKTLFPNSKVKNIVYRGVTEDSYNKTIRGVKQSYDESSSQTIIDLTFFTGSEDAATKYATQSAKKYSSNPVTFPAIVNAVNPLRISNVKDLGPKMQLEKYLKQTGQKIKNEKNILHNIDYIDNYKMLYGKTPSNLSDFRQFVIKIGGNLNNIKDDELQFILKYLNNKPRVDVNSKGLKELGYDSVIVDESKDIFDFNYDQVGVDEGQYMILGSPKDVVSFNQYVKLNQTNN